LKSPVAVIRLTPRRYNTTTACGLKHTYKIKSALSVCALSVCKSFE
jgi:hypothetical protein